MKMLVPSNVRRLLVIDEVQKITVGSGVPAYAVQDYVAHHKCECR